MRKFILALLSVFLITVLTACGSSEERIVDENGDIIHYPETDISEGYWILKDDGYYYQFLNMGSDTDNNGNIFLWFTEPYDAGIPRFTTKDKLLFYSETARPSSVTLYKLTDYGYTLGTMFKVSNNTGDLKYPQIIDFAGKHNPYSQVGEVISAGVTSNATTYITGINNHDFTSTLLVDDSFLKGLTKDTMYQIEFYCGTVRKTINIKADTHLFLQEATYVTSSYEELKAKCFEISLPSNLAPGYYYSEAFGMFYYEGTIKDIDDDDIDQLINDMNDNQNSSEDVIGDVDDLYDEEIYNEPDNTLDDLNAYENGNNQDSTIGDTDQSEDGEDGTEDVIGDVDVPTE